MMQIPPEFIINTLKNGYSQYNETKDEERRLKIYGFCDGLERLLYKFAPQYTQEVKDLQKQFSITKTVNIDTLNLDEPTWMRKH